MEANPYQSPVGLGKLDETEDRSIASRKRLRRIALLTLYLVFAANAAAQASGATSGIINILFAVAAASLATYLCVIDSRIRGRPIVQSLHWIIFFTWPLAVPIYLIYSRRLRGVFLIVLHGIGVTVVSNAALYLTWYLAHGALWFEVTGN